MQSVRTSFDKLSTWSLATLRPIWHYVAIAAATVLIGIAAGEVDAFEQIHSFSRAHEDMELDELITLALCSTVGLVAALFVRSRELRTEIALRTNLEKHADKLARHDPLTGIANRRNFAEKSQELMAAASNSGNVVSLLAIDLDRFKPVNDLHGHSVGDITLQIVTDRITSSLRSTDLAARIGGDEFAVLLTHKVEDEAVVDRIARRILKAISDPIEIDGKRINVSSSIGVASWPRDASNFEDLNTKADLAMYRAKKNGRATFAYYDDDMGKVQNQRLELEADLRTAIEAGQIVPYLQPLVGLSDSKLLGFEILARWINPKKGLIPPDQFIGIAEDCGMIGDLMLSVLQQACETTAKWPGDFNLAVNLSPVQIQDRQLAAKVKSVCDTTGFAVERLEIEITEAVFISDSELALLAISELKDLGVSISLDDFGTGFSSMRYLSEFPIDKVKIDRSFVMGRDDNEKNEQIVNSIISLGHNLGMLTIAEGIEKNTDVEWLVEQGCDQGQGYLYSAPVALSDAFAFVETDRETDRSAKPSEVVDRRVELVSG